MSGPQSLSRLFIALLVLLAVAAVGHGAPPADAATFTVTKTADTDDGACNSDCSLREAIIAAEAAPGADTITFDEVAFSEDSLSPTTIFVEGSPLPTLSDTDLDASGLDVIIDGSLLVSGTGLNFNSAGSLTGVRVWDLTVQNFPDTGIKMTAGADLVNASIGVRRVTGNGEGINLNAGADNTGAYVGGYVYGNGSTGINVNAGNNLANATISYSAVDGNASKGVNLNGSNVIGATIVGSRIDGNGDGGLDVCCGGGVGTSLTINNSAINGNTTSGEGAGLYQEGTSTTIIGSTIFGNTAPDGAGGGIANYGVLSVTNSTISGNTAAFDGGGIYTGVNAELTLTNVTITGNTTQSSGSGGGLFSDGSPVNVQNTIIAGNLDTGGLAPDCAGPITSQGYNLIQDTSGCTMGGDTTGNITGQNPNLSPLGPPLYVIQAHGLLAGSPAIDTGNPAAPGSGGTACAATDQFGVSRPQDGNNDGLSRCDIGAYELQLAQPAPAPTTTPASTATPDQLPQLGAAPAVAGAFPTVLAVAAALFLVAAGAWAVGKRPS